MARLSELIAAQRSLIVRVGKLFEREIEFKRMRKPDAERELNLLREVLAMLEKMKEKRITERVFWRTEDLDEKNGAAE